MEETQYQERFESFYNPKWKPLTPRRIDSMLLESSSNVWCCFDQRVSICAILFYATKVQGEIFIYMDNKETKDMLVQYLDKYYKLNGVEISLQKKIPTIASLRKGDHNFIFTDNIDEINKYGAEKNTVIVTSKTMNKNSDWMLEDALMMKNLNKQENQTKLLGKYGVSTLENVISELYGQESVNAGYYTEKVFENIANSFARYPDLFVYGNESTINKKGKSSSKYSDVFGKDVILDNADKVKQTVDVLLGTDEILHENFVFRNRMKNNPLTSKEPQSCLWLIPDDRNVKLHIKNTLAKNKIAKLAYNVIIWSSRLSNIPSGNALIVADAFDTKMSFVDTLVLLDHTLTVNAVKEIISRIMCDNSKEFLHVVDFTQSRYASLKLLE